MGSYIHRFPDNGDFIILHYFIFNDLGIKRVADHLDPEGGFYWPRLRLAGSFKEKVERGAALAQRDFCDYPGTVKNR